MFIVRKFLAPLFFPFLLSLELILLGLILLVFSRRQKAGKALAALGFLFLVLAGQSLVADTLLAPLERAFRPAGVVLSRAVLPTEQEQAIRWVVVLGGGSTFDPLIPVPDRLSGASLARLVEGICLYRKIPGSRLILSGGKVFNIQSDAAAMQELAEMLGVPAQDIVLDSLSLDTEGQARNLKPLLLRNKFFLVTSAAHMPRAEALFASQGMSPIPAPTGFLLKQNDQLNPERIYPSVQALGRTEISLHEYLGSLWGKLRGRM